MSKEKISIFWFRRDLRLDDNIGLYKAYNKEDNVLPLFIFDKNILDDLEEKDDARVTFIHDQVTKISKELAEHDSSLLVKYGDPERIFKDLLEEYEIQSVYTNRDYEPYAKERDEAVVKILKEKDIPFYDYKDQVIYDRDEIPNKSGDHYKVFTPYSRLWLQKFKASKFELVKLDKRKNNFYKTSSFSIPSLKDMGFKKSDTKIPPLEIDKPLIRKYDEVRDYPAEEGTTRLGIHLRFGTLSIRKLALEAKELNETFLNELIWREFYMMILHHNPQVVDKSFKPEYDKISWRNDEDEFQKWCEGKTGYPIVDAGMRQLNSIGFMHNRVRMIVASFLTKHLLIDWRWGEAYFAKKLLDYELSSNNGGWQWAAGTGTDAQPYFRIFNPESQTEKFDKDKEYIKKWVPEFGESDYPDPIVDHKSARERALKTYKKALDK